MPNAPPEKKAPDADKDKQQTSPEDQLEDEEKILTGRSDVNYPALLTKDVPGG